MKLWIFILLAALPLTAVAGVELNGPVVGFKITSSQDRCYVAINDPSDKHYDNGYHHIDNRAMCSIAKAAFMTGARVRVQTQFVYVGDTNGVASIETIRAGAAPYWPEGGKYGQKIP